MPVAGAKPKLRAAPSIRPRMFMDTSLLGTPVQISRTRCLKIPVVRNNSRRLIGQDNDIVRREGQRCHYNEPACAHPPEAHGAGNSVAEGSETYSRNQRDSHESSADDQYGPPAATAEPDRRG